MPASDARPFRDLSRPWNMFTLRQKLTVLVVCVVTMAAMGLVVALRLRPVRPLPLRPVKPAFDPAAAIEYTRTLAEDYPDRVTGSPGARRAAEYLSSEFQKLGYRVSGDLFTMWLAGSRVEGENVIAELPGSIPESVAVIAHYDGQTTSHQAAEDNASGVGAMLELARALQPAPRYRGLIFVATDAEEWGMIGARSLIGFFRARQTVAVISIDYLTEGRATALAIDCEGQGSGYTPLWLRQLMEEAVSLQGARLLGSSLLWEWIERSLEVSAQDQGPLLRAGIAAVNVSTVPADIPAARARYHSDQDVFQNFEPATFAMLGEAVELAVSWIDHLGPSPPPEQKYLQLSGNRWLDRPAVEWLQTLGLLPFMLACVLAIFNLEDDHLPHPLLSYLRPLIYWLPPVAALLTLYGLVSANVLRRYELYPATPKDPFLYQVPLQVVLPLLFVLLLGYGVVRIFRVFLPPGPDSFPALKRIYCLWTYVLVVWALYINPSAMWLFLGLFAYGVICLRRPSSAAARLVNLLLLLLMALPFVLLLYFFGREIYLGWAILWYLVLQAAYHVWSVYGVLAFLLAVTLWIQLFRMAVLGRPVGVRRRQPAEAT